MKNIKRISYYLIITFVFSGMSSCYYEGSDSNRIEGSGLEVTRTLELGDFKGFIIQNSAKVFLRRGDIQAVEVQGQENIIKNLDNEVSGGLWRIRNKRRVWRSKGVVINITMSDFNNLHDIELKISGSGSGNIRS